MEAARAAVAEVDAVDAEIARVVSELEVSGAGLSGPLVDSDGYPRSDVDVHAVTIARSRLAKLKTDRTQLTSKVEHALHAAHAEAATESARPTASVAVSNSSGARSARQPFATVRDVVSGSPAASAGLLDGDKLLLFGNLDSSNCTGLAELGRVTQQASSTGNRLRVMVQRGKSTKLLQLWPQVWEGAGLLGCRVVD